MNRTTDATTATETHATTETNDDLETLAGVGPATAEKLEAAGFSTITAVADAAMADLVEIDGLGYSTAATIKDAAIDTAEDGEVYEVRARGDNGVDMWCQTFDNRGAAEDEVAAMNETAREEGSDLRYYVEATTPEAQEERVERTKAARRILNDEHTEEDVELLEDAAQADEADEDDEEDLGPVESFEDDEWPCESCGSTDTTTYKTAPGRRWFQCSNCGELKDLFGDVDLGDETDDEPEIMTDGGQPQADASDVIQTASEGDRVLFNDRVQPLTVTRSGERYDRDDWIVIKGPRGGTYRATAHDDSATLQRRTGTTDDGALPEYESLELDTLTFADKHTFEIGDVYQVDEPIYGDDYYHVVVGLGGLLDVETVGVCIRDGRVHDVMEREHVVGTIKERLFDGHIELVDAIGLGYNGEDAVHYDTEREEQVRLCSGHERGVDVRATEGRSNLEIVDWATVLFGERFVDDEPDDNDSDVIAAGCLCCGFGYDHEEHDSCPFCSSGECPGCSGDETDEPEIMTDGGWPSDARTAGKWHSWCADCGSKNHKNADKCSRCGYGSDGQAFTVKYRGNVGKPEYTSDGEEGVYRRDVEDRVRADAGQPQDDDTSDWQQRATELKIDTVLTERQAQVRALTEAGRSRQAIADELEISINTVDEHRKAIKHQIQRAQATVDTLTED